MKRMETIVDAVSRVVDEVLTSLAAAFTARQLPEGAFAYSEVIEPEEVGEAEHRAAVIRERMRREGWLR